MASRTTTDPIEILLEMGVDLDNLSSEEDYLSALMEAVNTLTIKDPTDPRIAPLQLEVRNVRKQRKAADPKFKEKKTKISVDNISTIKKQLKPVQSIPSTALVPYQSGKEEEQKQTEKQESKDTSLLANISKNVTDIADLLRQQYRQKQKAARSQRTQAEQAKRKAQESNLEKSFGFLEKAAEKIIAPVKSALSSLFDFFLNIFIGRFLVKFFDWFGDPKNQDKVTSLIRFFADHGLKLIAAFLLFGTGLGRLITGLVGKLIMGTGAILKFVATNPFAAGAALFGAGAIIPALFPDTVDAEEKKTKAAPGTKEEKLEKLRDQKENLSFIDKLFGVDKEIDEQIEFIETGKTKQYSGGGEVSGPAGIDKVPAMLTDGEFVMSKGAVQKFGVRQLEAMNAAGGGTNLPKMVDNTVYAAGGGLIGLPGMGGGGGGTNAITSQAKARTIGSVLSDPFLFNLEKKQFNDPQNYLTDEDYKNRGSGSGSPQKGYSSEERNETSGFKDFKEKYIAGDDSLLNKLALGDTAGALELLGIKIDNNTAAINQNTDQRKKENKTLEGFQKFINNRKKELKGGMGDATEFLKTLGGSAAKTSEEIVNSRYNPLYAIGEELTNISKKSYFGEDAIDKLTQERIASGELGEDGLGLTKTTQANLDKNDAYIRSLYDPEKDTGFMGGLKKMNQTIQNKGAILDPLAALGLKEEGTEKFIEKVTGGRVKNFGAKLTGVQMAAKGLLGPLGRMFQIDDRGSLGRYLRPAMEEAQRQGHTSVGREALGGKKYDELVGDKLANLALGQVHFEVDKDGRAKTSDVFDASALTPKQYLEKSRKALGDAGNMLMGKEVLDAKGEAVQGGPVGIAKALYQSAFMGLSGRLATAQNSGFGNLRPMGLDIDLGSGFAPKKTPMSEEKKQSMMNMMMGGKDAYYSSTTNKYYKNYTEALKDPKVAAAAQVEKTKAKLSFAPTPPKVSPPPPPSFEPKVNVISAPAQQGSDSVPTGNGSGSEVDARPTGNGNANKFKIFGISLPF